MYALTVAINSATPTWFSFSPTLNHFRDAMDRAYFWETVRNSLVIVCVAVLASIVIAFLAAIALAKYRFGGRKLLIVLMIGILMLPQAGLVIPLYVVLAKYHLVGTMTGVILTYLTFVLPFAVGFLLSFTDDTLVGNLAAGPYFDFVTTMFLAFGLILEFPILLYGLSRVGIITSQRLTSSRRYIILGISIFAAVVTPGGDLVSPFVLGGTMYVLFELTVLFIRRSGR